MTIIKLHAEDQNLSSVSEIKIASGNRKSVEIQVDFSAEWDGYNISAVFFTERDSTVYEVLLTDGKCLVPSEVLAFPALMYVGIRGVTTDAVKASFLVRYRVEKGAPVGTGTAVDPSSDLYQQLLERFDSKLLPDVTEADEGKFLQVAAGVWVAVDALPQMTALINAMFVPMTQAEYDALVTAGTVDASKYYMIVGEST